MADVYCLFNYNATSLAEVGNEKLLTLLRCHTGISLQFIFLSKKHPVIEQQHRTDGNKSLKNTFAITFKTYHSLQKKSLCFPESC